MLFCRKSTVSEQKSTPAAGALFKIFANKKQDLPLYPLPWGKREFSLQNKKRTC
jgi:hypothetical protein